MSRKFRWTCEADFPGGKTKPIYVKVNARPNLNIEEVEKNFLDAKAWIPGKQEWEQLTTTYFDVQQDEMIDLYKIIASVYDFADPNYKPGDPIDVSKAGTIKLRLLVPDYSCPNCGKSTWGMALSCSAMKPIEEWTLTECWPMSINFGELDYSSSDELTVEITWRYKSAVYKNLWEELPKETQTTYKVEPEVPTVAGNKNMGLGKIGDNSCTCKINSSKTVDPPTTI